MKHSKKYLMLGLSLITFSIYCAKKTSSQAQPTAQASTQPKPMTTTPTTVQTVTNSTTSNVSVIFYDKYTNALTSLTNLGPKQALNIPVGAVFISVRSGSKEIISLESIASGKSYIIMYTNAGWTLKAL